MTDREFDVLDELYFVTPFQDLLQTTASGRTELVTVLRSLHEKGWIKVMKTIDEELTTNQVDLEKNAADYFFLATKSGLLAHNS